MSNLVKPSRLRRGLVMVQMALSLSLLCAAALFAHSLYKLFNLDLGLRTDRLTVFTVRQVRAPRDAQRNKLFYSQLLTGLQTLPGVEAVSLTSVLPLTGGGGIWLGGDPTQEGPGKAMLVGLVQVDASYFDTLRMPLLSGRSFTAQEQLSSPKVAVANESLARMLRGPAEAPLGQRLGMGRGQLDIRIVGVVKDTRAGLRRPPQPTIFVPYFQSGESNKMAIVARTRTDGILANTAIREVLKRIDPASPITDLKSMATVIGETVIRDRMLAILSMGFAVLAAGLSTLGLFGLTSFGITQRFREIGIRIAIGGAGRSILWLLMREVVTLTACGSAIGLAVSLGFNQAMRPFLFNLSPLDVPTLAGAALLLTVVALAAGLLPAMRATRLDPPALLRQE